ncbi:MAG: alpha/beta fold hydrolase, partial [Microbacterium sp.]
KHHFAHLAAAALATPSPDATASADSANRAILSASGWEDLTAVSAPMTLVRATRGFVSEADADQWQQRLPAGRTVALDATHNVQETAPGELAGLVRDALDSPA